MLIISVDKQRNVRLGRFLEKLNFVEITKKLVKNSPIPNSIEDFGTNVKGQQALKVLVKANQKVNAEKANGLRVNQRTVFPLAKIVPQRLGFG